MPFVACTYSVNTLLLLMCIVSGAVEPDIVNAQVRDVSDRPSCSTCTVAVRRIISVGSSDGDGSLAGIPMSATIDRRKRTWVMAGRELAQVFDGTGRFAARVGTSGRGPLEFAVPVLALGIPGDSMVILDGALGRAIVVGQNLTPSRGIEMPFPTRVAAVERWPDRVWIRGQLPTRDARFKSLHLTSFAGERVTVSRSIDPEVGIGQGRDPNFSSHHLGARRAGGVWTVDETRFVIRGWDANGEPTVTLKRAAPWFASDSMFPVGTRTSPPPHRVTGIAEDDRGYLWVVVQRPAPTWRKAWANWPEGSARETPSNRIATELLWVTRVEVIDPASGSLVASRDLDNYAFALMPGLRLASMFQTADGIPRVIIHQLSLEGAPRR